VKNDVVILRAKQGLKTVFMIVVSIEFEKE
jgi:hypothetical protein